MKRLLKILFCLVNMGLGAFLVYDGWRRGGIFLLTVLFAGAVMFFFGLAMLFVPLREKKKVEYKDVYIDRR
ncbi:MAG: hypothetical protein OEV91_06950 [Desulfobulbaceae bacterium]|nr:hypothetical protein [Desulfobulbaceae bacterium]